MRLFYTVAGTLLGGALSILTTLGWFLWTGHTPTDPAGAIYILATAAVSVSFALLAGLLAASIAQNAITGYGAALLILAFSALAILETRSIAAGHGSLWWMYVSTLLVAPAAALGGLLGVRRVR